MNISTAARHAARRMAAMERANAPRGGSCARKHRHDSERSAERAADAAAHRSGIEMYIYPCAWCGGWHITSQARP